MKKTQITAIKSILSERGKGHANPFAGLCASTGLFFATDSYALVRFENATEEEVDVFRSDDKVKFYDDTTDPKAPNIETLFKPFMEEYYGINYISTNPNNRYSEDRREVVTVKEIQERYKEAKAAKKDNYEWYKLESFGTIYNIELLKNVCNALGTKKVHIYYPGAKSSKPIVIEGITEDFEHIGKGLVMPMRA